MIRVAVVDDHPHVAIALRALLDRTPDIRLVAEARRGGDVPALVRQARPNILLLDLLIEPQFDALSTVRALHADFPELRICLLSAFLEPSMVRELLQAGVSGYILKDDDYVSKIEVILRDLVDGQVYLSTQVYQALVQEMQSDKAVSVLSDRELEILRLAERGLPNPQIAQSLHISPGTVRNHLSAIYRKLGVHSRHEALQIAAEKGWI